MAAQYSNGALSSRLGLAFANNSKQKTFKDIEAEIIAGQKLFSTAKQWESSYEQEVHTELLYLCFEEELRHAEYENLMDEFNQSAGFEQSEFERWTIAASASDWYESYEQAVHAETLEDALEESSECYWSIY